MGLVCSIGKLTCFWPFYNKKENGKREFKAHRRSEKWDKSENEVLPK